MSVLKNNIIANVLGKGISALLTLVFVPMYLKYLGAEAYGIVGVFATLQSVFMLADMGLSGTFIRETARLSVMDECAQQLRDLCRTFEGIFAVVGFLSFLIIVFSSRLIAEHWVNLERLSVDTVSSSLVLIGVAVGLQFPFIIYQGGMQGLQRQVHLNILLLGVGLARGVGAVIVLKFIDPSLKGFFVWQVAISSIQLVAGYLLIWNCLPPAPEKPRFAPSLILPLWRFAAGTAGTMLTGILLTQSDKLILTKILSLEEFGYYAFAGVVASLSSLIAMPFNNAVYPRFTQLVAEKKFNTLTDLYHLTCQMIAVLLLPIGLVVTFFSKELILVWTGSIETANNTCLLASVLMIGSTLMGLMLIPYALQLAFAWTRLGLIMNIFSVITLIPTMILLVDAYGALGACFVWIALYAGQIFLMIHFMHRRILKGEKWKWYINDVGKPLFASLIVVASSRLIISDGLSSFSMVVSIACVFFTAAFLSAMSATLVRNKMLLNVRRFRCA